MLKRRLNIRQKCSLIIGCLLAFELVLLFFLDRALVDAERDLWQASIARAIALEGAMLQTTFTETIASAVAQRILNNDQAPVDTSGPITRIAEQVRSLRLLIQSTPNPDKALARLAKLEKRLLQFVGLTATNGANPTELMFGMNNMETSRKEGGAILTEIQDINHEQLVLMKRADQSSRSRQTVRQVILTGAVLNVTMVVLLAMAFNTGIANRLAIIRENSDRLGRKQPLRQPLEGGDEIAAVDHSFHQMAAQLSELDKLKRQFFASISHDIRSPLNSIYATVSLLAESDMFVLPDAAVSRLKMAARSCSRVVQIVNDLLVLEKIEEGHATLSLEPCPLNLTLEDTIASLSGLIEEKNITIDKDLRCVLVTGDPLWLCRVATNILSNAVKISPQNGKILVSVTQDDQFGRVEITDQGPGLAPENHERVFEWFKQTSDTSKRSDSSGLGLAIAKKIIEQHKGQIGVRSKPTEGATFWFTVPLDLDNEEDTLACVPEQAES